MSTTNMTLNAKQQILAPSSGTRQGCPFQPLLFNMVLEAQVLGNSKKQEKEIKGIKIKK